MVIDRQTTPVSLIRKSFRLFLIIVVFVGTVISGIMLASYRSVTNTDLNNLQEQELFAVDLQHQAISDVFSTITGDLLFLSQQNELQEYLATGNEVLLDEIASEYISISKQKRIYDQIRYFDINGMEKVRVNENQGSPARTTTKELQLKKQRYYFKECLKLAKGEIYISPFDLNIEKGKIEEPFKPVIRLGAPVFDKTNKNRGIVLVNYYGQVLLNKIIEAEPVSEGEVMLLNTDSYWLLSSQPEQEWGFMFNDAQRTLASVDRDAWKAIKTLEKGQITTSQGLYTFQTVYPLKTISSWASTGSTLFFAQNKGISRDAYHWHLVSFVSAENMAFRSKANLMKFFFVGAGLFLLIIIGALIISRAVTKQKIYQAQLQVMALFDPLTKLPNRTLFFDRLKMTEKHCHRYSSRFGLLYIDLDGFKEVNDNFGHEAGDELLTIISNILLKICRKSDTVARLGGDEFSVIYTELDAVITMENLASRIIDALKPSIELTAGKVTIGASIGISFYPMDSDNIEELIDLADKAMYVSKHKGKNRYTLAGNLAPKE